VLSGGEKNRLLLAKLFTRPSNVLVMDEPTNDLDNETLELLEELLAAYTGALLLVSHDRTFLNNVVTSTLVIEGGGRIGEYVGGYDDWLRSRERPAPGTVPAVKARSGARTRRPPLRRTLSFNERRELEALPHRIETLEAEQSALYAALADPSFYRRGGGAIGESRARLEIIERELAEAYERWESLEALNGKAPSSSS
jgi:ATP-binding cassette subfamily F protein uup